MESVTNGEVVKGIILHGGYGTRLRPLTHTGPKQLIPIANKPISQYVLEDLVQAGIKDIAIVLGSTQPEKVKHYYGDGSKFGARITYIEQGEPKGIAHAIGLCQDFVGGECFVAYLGDNLIKGGIQDYVKSAIRNPNFDAHILLTKVKEPQRFGVARFDEQGRLVQLVEKPKNPPSDYILAGIYILRPAIFDAISRLRPSGRGELEITEALQILLDEGKAVKHDYIEGWWKDTGKPEDIIEANRLVLDEMKPVIQGTLEEGGSVEGRVSLGVGTIVRQGGTVRGPVVIGENTTIESGAYVGPYTSIGNNCTIRKGETENSVIMDNCYIEIEDKITDSLIGPHSRLVSNASGRPKGMRFVLGEGSSVIL